MTDTHNATLRIPTDAYAYIEIQINGTKEEIVQAYHDFKNYYDSSISEGLSKKEFDSALDRYLSEGTLHSEEYAKMNNGQKALIQAIKRSTKRIARRNGNTEETYED